MLEAVLCCCASIPPWSYAETVLVSQSDVELSTVRVNRAEENTVSSARNRACSSTGVALVWYSGVDLVLCL